MARDAAGASLGVDRKPCPQTPACDRCSQGVMDSTNPHLLGACRCKCHLVGGVIDPAVLADRRLSIAELEARVDEWVRNG